MKAEKVLEYINNTLDESDELIGYFFGQEFNIGIYLIFGPLSMLKMKRYYIAVSQNGVHFHRVNLLEKICQSDFFSFDEIDEIKISKKGVIQKKIEFTFKNGRSVKVKSPIKGVKSAALFTPAIEEFFDFKEVTNS